MLDGEMLEVKRVDGDIVMYGEYIRRGCGEEEDWVEGETEDISKLIEAREDESEKEEVIEYSPDPDVRLVRNVCEREIMLRSGLRT
jgi:hypothetical protein